jgi:hypothetical protein
MPTFHTLHTIETVLALVGASLLIKGIEKCSDKYCSNTEASQIVHEVAETIKHDVDELKEFHNDEHKTSTPTSGLPEEAGSVGTARSEPESTVYNFAHNPTKLINKENNKITVSHEYVHLQ